MKSSHKLLIAIGAIALPLCIFYLPLNYANQQAAEAFSKGKASLLAGSFTEGIPHIRYALEQVRLSRGTIDQGTAGTARAIVLDASERYPAQSPELLKILHDYSIPLTCESKNEIFMLLLNSANALAASEKTLPSMGKPLYAAILWSQDCKLPDGPASAFNKMLETYLHGMGKKYTDDSAFVRERWGNGFVSEAHRTPVATKEMLDKAPAPAAIIAQITTIAKLSISRLTGALAPTTQPPAPQPPPAPAAAPQPATATVSTASPQPATATTPSPTASVTVTVTEPKKEEPKPEAPKPQQEIITKKQLEEKNKPKPKKEEPKKEPADPHAAAERDLLRSLAGLGIDVKQVNISKNGKAVEVTIISIAKGDQLKLERRNMYKTIYQRTVLDAAGVKASKIIINCNGKDGYPRYQLNSKVSDYELYLDNKLSAMQFLSRGRVTYGD